MTDLVQIQALPNEKMFLKFSKIFSHKWDHILSNLSTDYFSKNKNWYEAAAPELPSTNNGLESFNRTVKDDYTLRERLPFAIFKEKMVDMMRNISFDRSQECQNYKPFAETPNFSKAIQVEAFKTSCEKGLMKTKVLLYF